MTPTNTTQTNTTYYDMENDDDDITVVTSNCEPKIRPTQTAASIFATTKHSSPADAWQQMLHAHEAQHGEMPQAMLKAGGIKIAIDMAVADAGATSHFVLPGAPVTNITPTDSPLVITLPDGQTLQSTHTCELSAPWLPVRARKAHIVPGLAHTSLVSIKMLCEAGCKVAYDEDEVRVYFKRQVVWRGKREPTTGLWVLPLNRAEPGRRESRSMANSMLLSTIATGQETMMNAYKLTSKQALVKYLHQCLFSPPKSTLIRAIQQNHFPTWPGFTADAVRKYLPNNSPATDKGHMKRQRQGIRSTTRATKKEQQDEEAETFADSHPPLAKETMNQMFCGMAVIDKKEGTVYTDFTGNFPIRSSQGNMSVFIMYDWSSYSSPRHQVRHHHFHIRRQYYVP